MMHRKQSLYLEAKVYQSDISSLMPHNKLSQLVLSDNDKQLLAYAFVD